jgi:hypothetical protein
MATQREILDACMNDEPRQKLNEKKKHKFHPKIRSRDSQKKKIQGRNQTVRRSILHRKGKKKRKTKQKPAKRSYTPTYLQEKQERGRRRL